jgi:hypothetical protein
MYRSIWGGQQHSLVLNTTLSSSRAAAGWVGLLERLTGPWLAAGQKASKQAGSTAGTYTQLQLAEVSSSSSSDVLLLLDPDCSYELHLGLDMLGAGSRLLLGHASAAAGIAVALLLLVLSHQMSSLVRVMTVARHGSAVLPQAPLTHTAAAAAGGMSSTPSRSSSPIEQQQQQQRQYSQRQQLSGGSSRRRSPSPATAAAAAAEGGEEGGSGGGYIPTLPSPAANVAQRLVWTASSDVTDDLPEATFLDSSTDSDTELPHLPLLGFQQQQQQQRRQPSVADAGQASESLIKRVTAAVTTSPGTAAEWGLEAGVADLDPRPAAVSAMQRFRRQMTITLGGAPPPVEQLLAVAAGSSSRSNRRVRLLDKHSDGGRQQQQRTAAAALSNLRQQHSQPGIKRASWRGAGISVLGSLVAVTGDLRVLLLAAVLSAAAGSLNAWNTDSIWHHSSSSSSSGPPSRAAAAAEGAPWGHRVYQLLQQLLGVVGLSQRGDSPGIVGAVVLMGLALLVLLVAVGVSLALKWCLDYFIAAVAAFNR